MPNMGDEYKKRLNDLLFSKIIGGDSFETQIVLMIKLDPSRTISLFKNMNINSVFNTKLVSFNFLSMVAKNNPELKDEVCVVGKEVYQIAKDQASKDESSLIRLNLTSYGGGIKELCGF
jgi:hypothetical protein